jgi:cardiolipin synthase A/B
MNADSILLFILLLQGVIVASVVVLERRKPTSGLLWIGILVLLPGFGLLVYWLFGRRKFKRVAKKRTRTLSRFGSRPPALRRSEERNPQQRKLVRLAEKVTGCIATAGNMVEVLPTPETAYGEMLNVINGATQSVHLAMYIYRPDGTGHRFLEAMTAAAQRGIAVRLLLDGMGSLSIDRSFFRPLLEAGGEVEFFSPLRLRPLMQRPNFRNHRKILVVDGAHAFIGGINVGDEYLGLNPAIGLWRDTAMKITGPAANQVQQVFLNDWSYSARSMVDGDGLYNSLEKVGPATVQVISSGPDQEWGAIHKAFVQMITGADWRVRVTSPYFVPDEVMFHAMTTAALAGVEVDLIVPRRTDLPLLTLAARSYFPELIAAGVKIFEYEPGFIHAKTILVDDWVASVGSANLDIRSFELNYEITALVYDPVFVSALTEEVAKDMSHSRRVTKAHLESRSFPQKMAEGVARLMSPLM